MARKISLLIRARGEDVRWTATSAWDLHASTEVVARDLVGLSGTAIEAEHLQVTASEPAQNARIGRVTEILIRLHEDARVVARERRRAARERVASLA